MGRQEDLPGGGHDELPDDGHVLTRCDRLGGAPAPCEAPSIRTSEAGAAGRRADRAGRVAFAETYGGVSRGEW